jgi:hypothetical protein
MRISTRRSLGLASRAAIPVAVVALTANMAAASIVWDWNYSASGIIANGTFVTVDTPNADGGYLITAVTGSRNGEAITGLQPTGTSIPGNEPYTVDNLIFPGPGPQLTTHGFGFSTSGGNYSNPFYADFLPVPGYLEFFSMPAAPGDGHTELSVQFSAAQVAVPEPAALGTIAVVLALGTVVAIAFRKTQRRKGRTRNLLR